MRVFLTGFMGCGKTTTGRLLAQTLGRPFIDLDDWVEEGAGMDIRTIFRTQGEKEFRRLEQAALRKILETSEAVVATGGGTVTSEGCRELIRQHGLSVWLNPPFATIAQRIGYQGKWDRPLFHDETQALELYRRRLSTYRQADLVVDVGPSEQPAEVAARIVLMLGGKECSS